MDNVQKAINLAAHINARVEAITFDALRSNDNGATLWDVYDKSCDEHRYVIEGETGEMLSPMECTEDEATEAWDNA